MKYKLFKWMLFVCMGVFLLSCSSKEVQEVDVIPGTIVIYGDSRTGHDAHREVVSAMVKVEPIAIFHTGDLVADGRNPFHWAIFNEIVAPLLKSADFYPAAGNHEYNSNLYFDNFDLPGNEHWYTVDINSLHFVILDSNSPLGIGSEQYQWLKNDLERVSNNGFFVIVVFHHPPYSSGPHGPDEKNLRDSIVPLFEKYGVHMVFNGHDHIYERSNKNKIFYVVTGGGGAPLYKKENYNPFSQVFIRENHFCRLQKSENQLIVDVFNQYLEVIDHFAVKK